MKKSSLVIAAAILAAGTYFNSCASSSASTTPTVAKKSSPIERTMIDYKGAAIGAEIPDWVEAALADDEESLKSGTLAKKLESKKVIVVNGVRQKKTDKDLKLLQDSVNASYMVEIAQSLNNGVDRRFSGVLSSNEDTQKTLTANSTKAQFTGFIKAADYWVLQRITDKDKNKTYDQYTVIQVYACDEELFQQQAAQYIRRLGLDSDSEDLKKAADMADSLAAEMTSSPLSVTANFDEY